MFVAQKLGSRDVWACPLCSSGKRPAEKIAHDLEHQSHELYFGSELPNRAETQNPCTGLVLIVLRIVLIIHHSERHPRLSTLLVLLRFVAADLQTNRISKTILNKVTELIFATRLFLISAHPAGY